MPTLLVLLKYPSPGTVKTRLAASLGAERAAALYREWIGLVLHQLQPLRDATRVVGYFDGAPEAAFAPWRTLADDWWRQPAGDLGERLRVGFAMAHAVGAPVVAVGTDCLELETPLVRTAFETLAQKDAVFGPAEDGGYYLVGTARDLPSFFEKIPWSTPSTLAAHLALCAVPRLVRRPVARPAGHRHLGRLASTRPPGRGTPVGIVPGVQFRPESARGAFVLPRQESRSDNPVRLPRPVGQDCPTYFLAGVIVVQPRQFVALQPARPLPRTAGLGIAAARFPKGQCQAGAGLGQCHGRCLLFSRAASRPPRTTPPAATTSCGGANPPSSASALYACTLACVAGRGVPRGRIDCEGPPGPPFRAAARKRGEANTQEERGPAAGDSRPRASRS